MLERSEVNQENARVAAELVRQQQCADLQYVMSDVRGRRFLRRLIDACGIYRTSFSPEATSMAFSEGQRNIGLMLHDWLQSDTPGEFLVLLSEQCNESRNR